MARKRRSITIEIPALTEYYVVVSAEGTVEETRQHAANALRFLASQIETDGWESEAYELELEDSIVQIEADLVDPEERHRRLTQFDEDEGPAEA